MPTHPRSPSLCPRRCILSIAAICFANTTHGYCERRVLNLSNPALTPRYANDIAAEVNNAAQLINNIVRGSSHPNSDELERHEPRWQRRHQHRWARAATFHHLAGGFPQDKHCDVPPRVQLSHTATYSPFPTDAEAQATHKLPLNLNRGSTRRLTIVRTTRYLYL
jgi:hypothetical protein